MPFTESDLPQMADELSRCDGMAKDVLAGKQVRLAGSGYVSINVSRALERLQEKMVEANSDNAFIINDLKLQVARLTKQIADLKKPLIDLGFAETGQNVITYKNGTSLWYGWPSVVHTIVNASNYDKGESDEPV